MFFYKSKKKNTAKAQQNAEAIVRPAQDKNNIQNEKVSNVSEGLEIIGSLITTGKLRFDGVMKGTIEADSLIVGESGFIDGKLKANDAVILGQVKGSVTGKKVRLAATSKIHGDTYHEVIAIEDGATYEGSIKRITGS